MQYHSLKNKVDRIMNDRSYAGKRYFDLVMMSLIIFSVVFLIVEMSNEGDSSLGFLYVVDDVILAIFIMEYLSRLWVCSDIKKDFKKAHRVHKSPFFNFSNGLYSVILGKVRYMVKPMSIIDLLAILPMFRIFRAFRIFRLLRLFKLIRYSHNMENLFMMFREHASEMGIILAFISIIIIVSSTFIFILEKGGPTGYFETMADAVWWSFVTITTVGYGDKVPATDLGRVLGVFLMLSAIVAIALPSGVLASAMTQKFTAIREGRVSMKNFKNHIVICGWNNSAEHLLREIQRRPDARKWEIVAATLKPVSEIDNTNVIIKQGDFTKESVLMDLNINNAKYVLVVAEELRGISDESIDARSFLACNIIHDLNPDIYVIAQILNIENAHVLKKIVKNVEVIISDDITGGLLSNSIIAPGTSNLINTLVIENQENIIKVPVKKLKDPFNSFHDLIVFCRKPPYHWLPLALERDGELFINPRDDFQVGAEDSLFCIRTGIDY